MVVHLVLLGQRCALPRAAYRNGVQIRRRWFAAAAAGKKVDPHNKPDPRRTIDRRFEVRHPDGMEEDSPEMLMQAKMYTPEALKAEGLATNCKRMVDFGLDMPELLDRYGRRAAQLAAAMKPSEYSRLMNAFAKASYEHDRMLAAFTKTIPGKLPHFLPPDLSSVCNAYAKFRRREEALFRRFSLEMPHKLPNFAAHELRNVANSYARLSIRDDLLFDDIADEVLRRPEDFDGTSMMIIANAFAHFKIKKPRFWQVVTDWLLETYLDLAAKDVALVLNALSAVNFRQEQLIRTLLSFLLDGPPALLEELEPAGVSIALNALARLQWDEDPEQVAKLAGRAVGFLQRFDAREVTQLLHACTKLEPLSSNEELLGGLVGRARSLVESKAFNAQALSLIVHSCAVLQQRDVPLLTQIAKAVPDQVSDFTPQGLAMLAGGYSRLDVRSEILFYLLAQEMLEKMPLFTGQGVGIVLNAFGRMSIRNDKLVVGCRKQVRSLAEELSVMEIEKIEKGFRALDALDERTEGMLQKLRQDVAAADATLGRAADPWATEDDNLLRRLAESPHDSDASTSSLHDSSPARTDRLRERGQASQDVSRGPAGGTGGEGEEDDRIVDDGAAAGRPDLWTLWGPGASVGNEEATSSKRLREYLARPAHVGRIPIVVGEEDQDGLAGQRTSPASMGGGGRRARRQRRAAAREPPDEFWAESHASEVPPRDGFMPVGDMRASAEQEPEDLPAAGGLRGRRRRRLRQQLSSMSGDDAS